MLKLENALLLAWTLMHMKRAYDSYLREETYDEWCGYGRVTNELAIPFVLVIIRYLQNT